MLKNMNSWMNLLFIKTHIGKKSGKTLVIKTLKSIVIMKFSKYLNNTLIHQVQYFKCYVNTMAWFKSYFGSLDTMNSYYWVMGQIQLKGFELVKQYD